MSCGACIKVTCAETSSLPKYIGGYSLSNGTFAQNEETITVTTNTGNSPTEITFPPGTIQVSVPTNPVSPFTFAATYKQCNASYTIEIPPTQSAAFFDEVIQALAQQLGDCLGESATPGGGSAPHQFVNSPQTISCPGGSQMLLCNPSLYFPQGITFNSSGNGSLSILGGIVSATTLAAANAGAIQLLQSFLTNMLNSQNMACGGPCPQTCSQSLSGLTWSIANDSTGGATASGSVSILDASTTFNFDTSTGGSVGGVSSLSFTATIVNQNNTPCTYNATSDITSSPGASGSVLQVNCSTTVPPGGIPSTFATYLTVSGTQIVNTFPASFVIPANSSIILTVAPGGSTTGGTGILNGSITFSPA